MTQTGNEEERGVHRESGGAAGLPSFAVVIPCRNCETWIGRATKSALDQNPAAVIAIDDGSTDRSLDIIRSFGDRVLWRAGPQQGAPAARNRGLSLVTAEYVMFLDADDYVEGDLIPGMAAAAQAARADVVFGPFFFEQEDGTRWNGWRIDGAIDSAEALACAWLGGNYVPPCSVLWRTEFVSRIGGWRQTLLRNQDGELVLRALLEGARWTVSRQGAGLYFQHASENRISRNKSLQAFQASLGILDSFRAEGRSARLKEAFLGAYYDLARGAYRDGHGKLGDTAVARAAALGLSGHRGTFLHRAAASLLGLQTKERLAVLLNRGGAPHERPRRNVSAKNS
jgi:glycosyltransferase involved in cell wall biosynthesis